MRTIFKKKNNNKGWVGQKIDLRVVVLSEKMKIDKFKMFKLWSPQRPKYYGKLIMKIFSFSNNFS